jgi:hypothetical protein
MAERLKGIARRVIGYTVAVCLVVLRSHTTLAQDDAFERQRDAQAAKNASNEFSVAFASDRRAFHPGETITLMFTFGTLDVSPHNYEHCRGLGLAEAVLDHSDGTADPQADLWDDGIITPTCGILSGVRGATVRRDGTVEERPIEFAVYLNQAVRFDRAGRYRLYVRSRHRDVLKRGGDVLPPLISTLLEFEITARDQEWEGRTLEGAVRILNSWSDPSARTEAARSISYLGTAGATDEMARRLYQYAPRRGGLDPGDDLDAHWLRGLYGARDRALVVRAMERELDRAERYVSPAFLSHSALLALTGRVNSRPIDGTAYQSQVGSYLKRHAAAVKAGASR